MSSMMLIASNSPLKAVAHPSDYAVYLDVDKGIFKRTVFSIDKLAADDLRKLDLLEVWKEPATDYCCIVTGKE